MDRGWRLLIALTPFWALGQGLPGSIDGRVTNSVTGEPIGSATVRLVQLANRRQPGAAQNKTTTSQADGRFQFDEIGPGNYFVSAQASGFVAMPGQARFQRVTIGDGQHVGDLSIQLSPEGSLTGRVVDESDKPVQSASLEVYKSYTLSGKLQLQRSGSAKANEDGEFAFKKLNPGKYYLSADPGKGAAATDQSSNSNAKKEAASAADSKSDSDKGDLVRTFYPDTLDFTSATPIEVGPGQTNGDIVVKLKRAVTYRVRGRIPLAEDGGPNGATVALSPRDTLDSDVLGHRTEAAKDGTFEFSKVLPGSYTLWLMGNYAGPERRQAQGHGSGGLLGRQDIDVTGADVDDVVLGLIPPVNLTGTVSADNFDPKNLSQTRIAFVPTGAVAVGNFLAAPVAEDGTFTVQNLMPGKYVVRVQNLPTGVYTKSVAFNRRDVTTEPLDISQGGAGQIEIELRMGTGQVDGTVETNDSEGVPETTTAVLIADTQPLDGFGLLMASARAGTFVFNNVPPGRYLAFAISHWTSFWQNTDFLQGIERSGTSVTISENGRVELQVPLLPDEQIAAAAEGVGLTVQ